ncbi:MAG: hypothetical protein FWH46_04210, partial [Methanimicrococcus sp.]|nr:hypothetical protein [Methanimicrococcus sp.]
TDVFSNGLKSIKNNTILFVPMTILIAIAIIGGIVIGFSSIFLQSFENIWIIVLAYLCFVLLVFIMGVFTTAGQIGMAKEVASTGKTGWNHFMSYGKRFFGRVFAANIILALIQAVTLIFWIPTFYVIYNSGLITDGFIDDYVLISLLPSLFLTIMIGCILTIIYAIVVYVLFFFVNYNIIVDDISAIDSFKKSLSLLKAKTSQVLLFIVVLYIASMILSSIMSVFLMPIMMLIFFGAYLSIAFLVIGYLLYVILLVAFSIILEILTVVWITRFYMAITEKPLYVKEKITN